MIKKLAEAIILLGITVLSLAGCGRNDNSNANDQITSTPDFECKETNNPDYSTDSTLKQNNNTQSNGSGKDLITIGFAQVGHESDWRMAATESAQEIFSENNGYELNLVDSVNDMEIQIQAVKNFIEEKVDYIIIDPIVTTGWDTVLNDAKLAGIPVFVIDRTIDCDESLYEAWFGSNFTAEGEAAGAWLTAYLDEKGRGKEPVNIVTVAGSFGSSAQLGRTQGFDKYVDSNTKWTKLDEVDGEFTQTGGRNVMNLFLEKYEDIDVVVCQNDNEAWGVMDALKAAGKTYGKDGDIIIISFDAVHDGLESVLNGSINADFECNPLSAPYIADAIQVLESGGRIYNKINYIDEACFQAEDNVDTIEFAGKKADMITVDERVLESRAY